MEPQIIRIGVLLAIFASVFLVSQLLLAQVWRHRSKFAAINRRLRMIREGGDREKIVARLRKSAPEHQSGAPGLLARPVHALQRLLFAAALPIRVGQAVLFAGGAFLFVLVAMLFLARLGGFDIGPGVIVLVLVISACITLVIPLSVISIRAQRRQKLIEEQFPVALDIFVRALRSGHPITSAIDLLTHEMEDPIGSEFGLVADEVSYGAEMIDALQDMAVRWNSSDMRMFVVSLAVQTETGGNLAEILENLAGVIRARAAMYMKVRALSSEGRMTAWMLSVLPVISFLGMFLVNPAFYLDVAADPIFIIGFGGLIALYFIGLLIMRKMIDLKV